MNAPLVFPFNGDAIEANPLQIDPRPCELCGRTIDQHQCVDHGEGPEFFCWDDDDIVTSWELADPRDAWRRTGEPPPAASVRNSDIAAKPARAPQPYHPAQSTVDAFRFLTGAGDVGKVRQWLADRPKDAPALSAFTSGAPGPCLSVPTLRS
jgi:hypothetical protein